MSHVGVDVDRLTGFQSERIVELRVDLDASLELEHVDVLLAMMAQEFTELLDALARRLRHGGAGRPGHRIVPSSRASAGTPRPRKCTDAPTPSGSPGSHRDADITADTTLAAAEVAAVQSLWATRCRIHIMSDSRLSAASSINARRIRSSSVPDRGHCALAG
jgi:hypothetical protein